MGLEDFERQLAENRESTVSSSRRREGSGERKSKHHDHHHHHQRSHRHPDGEQGSGSERKHRHKRHRDRGEDEGERRHRKRHRAASHEPDEKAREAEVKVFGTDDEEDEWVEKEGSAVIPDGDTQDRADADLNKSRPQRDAWMQEPSALDVEVVRSRKPEVPKGQFISARDSHEFKMHQSGVKSHLADLERDLESEGGEEGQADEAVTDEPAQHDVSYSFGDAGSAWRMKKLKNIYRQADDSKRPVDELALERYGNLRDFDDAREEEREMDRRKMYGEDYVGLVKPSGEFFQERKMNAGVHRPKAGSESALLEEALPRGKAMPEGTPAKEAVALDSSALNRLKAQMMKAKLRSAANAAQLEEEYNIAADAALANSAQGDVIVLNNMENRMLAGNRGGEVTALSGKRARERGLVEENEDMSIEDMVRNEKRTRGAFGGEGKNLAERIAKDSKFQNDLEYMDDNATKLSKKVVKSETNLQNTAISDFQKVQKALETCPLCYHEEANQPPTAPIVSLATRTYLTLPTEPELAKLGAVIVPIQHHLNLLECDDDEWEEMRNFMKSLTRFYDSVDRSVIFYENAAHMHSRRGHAALFAVPLPHHMADDAPAYFREAILSSDEQWSQHKPIIDTMALAQRPGFGKQAFRKSMAKEMAYFHVWYTLDGGMGHVIEDERRWPKGDLFAREIFGGMLDRGPEIVKKQGRWERGDRRVEGFRKKWAEFDWTSALME